MARKKFRQPLCTGSSPCSLLSFLLDSPLFLLLVCVFADCVCVCVFAIRVNCQLGRSVFGFCLLRDIGGNRNFIQDLWAWFMFKQTHMCVCVALFFCFFLFFSIFCCSVLVSLCELYILSFFPFLGVRSEIWSDLLLLKPICIQGWRIIHSEMLFCSA